MYLLFNWCNESGVISIFKMLKAGLNIVRFLVPIGLIVWTMIELFKNVLNPDDKDSKKKIMNRAIAAIIVFLIPTIVNLVMNLVDIGLGSGKGYDYNVSECWKKA